MTPDNSWHLAKAWARDHMVQCKEIRERCYKGPTFGAGYYFSDNPEIILDYSRMNNGKGVQRLVL